MPSLCLEIITAGRNLAPTENHPRCGAVRASGDQPLFAGQRWATSHTHTTRLGNFSSGCAWCRCLTLMNWIDKLLDVGLKFPIYDCQLHLTFNMHPVLDDWHLSDVFSSFFLRSRRLCLIDFLEVARIRCIRWVPYTRTHTPTGIQ